LRDGFGLEPHWLLRGEPPIAVANPSLGDWGAWIGLIPLVVEDTTTTTPDGGPVAYRMPETSWRCSVCRHFVSEDERLCATCGRLLVDANEA
jgi:hypothetical protein